MASCGRRVEGRILSVGRSGRYGEAYALVILDVLPSRHIQVTAAASGCDAVVSATSTDALQYGAWSAALLAVGPDFIDIACTSGRCSRVAMPTALGGALTGAGSILWERTAQLGSSSDVACVVVCDAWVAAGAESVSAAELDSSLAATVGPVSAIISHRMRGGPAWQRDAVVGACSAIVTAAGSNARGAIVQRLWEDGFVLNALSITKDGAIDGTARAALLRAATVVCMASASGPVKIDACASSRIVDELFDIIAAPLSADLRGLLCESTVVDVASQSTDDDMAASEAARTLRSLACHGEFTACFLEALRARLSMLDIMLRGMKAGGVADPFPFADECVAQIAAGIAGLVVLGGGMSKCEPGGRVARIDSGDGGTVLDWRGELDAPCIVVCLDSDPSAEPTRMSCAEIRPPVRHSFPSELPWMRAIVDDVCAALNDVLRLEEAGVYPDCSGLSERARVLTVVALVQAHAALAASALGAQLCAAAAPGELLRTLLERAQRVRGGATLSPSVLAYQLCRLVFLTMCVSRLPPLDAASGGSGGESGSTTPPRAAREHTGEYRDITARPAVRRNARGEVVGQIKIYCGSSKKPEDGLECVHPGHGYIRESHFSCCGAREFGGPCDATSAGGHSGEWRATSVRPALRWSASGTPLGKIVVYCSSGRRDGEGAPCAHPRKREVKYDHFSCCGAREWHVRCGAAAGVAPAGRMGQGHAGEFRDSDGLLDGTHMRYSTARVALGRISTYCAAPGGTEGTPCTHDGKAEFFDCAHWSCCGARAAEFNCPLSLAGGAGAHGAVGAARAADQVKVPAVYSFAGTWAPARDPGSGSGGSPGRLESVAAIEESVRMEPRWWAACRAAAQSVAAEAAGVAALACIVGLGDAHAIGDAMAASPDDLVAIARDMHALAVAGNDTVYILSRLDAAAAEALKRLPAGLPALARAAVLAVETAAAGIESAAAVAGGTLAPRLLRFAGWALGSACQGVESDVARSISAAARILAADQHALDVCTLVSAVARGPATASAVVCSALRDFAGALGTLIFVLDEMQEKKASVKSRRLQGLIAAAVSIDAALGGPAHDDVVADMRALLELATAFATGGAPASFSDACFAVELAAAQTQRVSGRGAPCDEMDGIGGRAVVHVPGARSLEVSLGELCWLAPGKRVCAMDPTMTAQLVPMPLLELRLESAHPYANNTDSYSAVHLPGASRLFVEFFEGSKTEVEHDYVLFLKDDSNKKAHHGEKYSGGMAGGPANWPGCGGRPRLEIPGDKCVLYFHSDTSDRDWGWSCRVTGEQPAPLVVAGELVALSVVDAEGHTAPPGLVCEKGHALTDGVALGAERPHAYASVPSWSCKMCHLESVQPRYHCNECLFDMCCGCAARRRPLNGAPAVVVTVRPVFDAAGCGLPEWAAARAAHAGAASAGWSPAADAALLRHAAARAGERFGEADWASVAPREAELGQLDTALAEALAGRSGAARLTLLQQYNRLLARLLGYIDVGAADVEGSVAQAVGRVRWAVVMRLKRPVLDDALLVTQAVARPLQLSLNRRRAVAQAASRTPDVGARNTFFGQAFRVLHALPPAAFRVPVQLCVAVGGGDCVALHGRASRDRMQVPDCVSGRGRGGPRRPLLRVVLAVRGGAAVRRAGAVRAQRERGVRAWRAARCVGAQPRRDAPSGRRPVRVSGPAHGVRARGDMHFAYAAPHWTCFSYPHVRRAAICSLRVRCLTLDTVCRPAARAWRHAFCMRRRIDLLPTRGAGTACGRRST